MNKIELEDSEMENEIAMVKANAMSLNIIDNKTYMRAGEHLKSFKLLEKKIKDYFKPLKEGAHKAWKNICDKENEELEKLNPSIKYLNQQMVAYNQEQERLRREEAERLRREAEKAEEERRLQAAIEAEKAGYNEEAESILAEPVFIPQPIVERQVPKLSGQSMTTAWKWRVIDINLVPRTYLKLDEIALNGIARSLKDKAKVQGIEFFPESSMRTVREKNN